MVTEQQIDKTPRKGSAWVWVVILGIIIIGAMLILNGQNTVNAPTKESEKIKTHEELGSKEDVTMGDVETSGEEQKPTTGGEGVTEETPTK